MKNYNRFINLYKKVVEEILDKKIPVDVIHIIENNFPKLLKESKAAGDELFSFNQNSDIEYRIEKYTQIDSELHFIVKEVRKLIDDFKQSAHHFDEEMERIITLFLSFRYNLPKNIDTRELYVSKNNDFLLAVQEMTLIDEEKEIVPDFDSYKTIVFKNNEVIERFYTDMKKHFSNRNHYILKQAIKGIDIGNGKLIFHGDAKEFVVYFKSLYDDKLLISRQKLTIKWIMDNFKFYKGENPSDFKIETIKKYLRKEI